MDYLDDFLCGLQYEDYENFWSENLTEDEICNIINSLILATYTPLV